MRLQSSILNIIMCCNQVAAGKISIVIVPIPLFTKRKTISAHELPRWHQESVWHAYSFLRLLVISDLWTFNQTRDRFMLLKLVVILLLLKKYCNAAKRPSSKQPTSYSFSISALTSLHAWNGTSLSSFRYVFENFQLSLRWQFQFILAYQFEWYHSWKVLCYSVKLAYLPLKIKRAIFGKSLLNC